MCSDQHQKDSPTEQEHRHQKMRSSCAETSQSARMQHESCMNPGAMQKHNQHQHHRSNSESSHRFGFIRNLGQKRRQTRHLRFHALGDKSPILISSPLFFYFFCAVGGASFISFSFCSIIIFCCSLVSLGNSNANDARTPQVED